MKESNKSQRKPNVVIRQQFDGTVIIGVLETKNPLPIETAAELRSIESCKSVESNSHVSSVHPIDNQSWTDLLHNVERVIRKHYPKLEYNVIVKHSGNEVL